MKNSKVGVPVMILGLAVGLAFANTPSQSGAWIDLNGTPTQMSHDPCTGTGLECKVIFGNDPQGRVFQVYANSALTLKKSSGSGIPYEQPVLP